MAFGSITELRNQLIIAKDVEYIGLSDFDAIDSQAMLVEKYVAD